MARDGSTHSYTETNRDNEYGQIDSQPLTYDAAGNLSVDEDGRQYFYDEQNRLIEIKAADNTPLASYDYDALGRRVQAAIGSVTTRYHYSRDQIIEERDGSDIRLRLHVPGSQYIDEQVATWAPSPPNLDSMLNDGYSGFIVGDMGLNWQDYISVWHQNRSHLLFFDGHTSLVDAIKFNKKQNGSAYAQWLASGGPTP